MSTSPRPYGTLAVLACAVVGVTLAACSGSGPAPRAVDLTSADRASVIHGGTLRWAVDAAPTTLNTFQADAADGTALVARAVLPTLFDLDAHAGATPDKDFLTGVEQTSQKPQTIVYHLNPAAVWSDGKHLSAADFTAQWKALNGSDPGYWTARTDGYSDISAIRQGRTPHDVEVTFNKPYGPWRGLFAPLYPAAAMAGAEAFNQASRTALPAYSGPFILRDLKGGTATVVRNPRWWGDPAKLDAVAFTPVAPDDRNAALRAGRLDVADVSRSIEDGGGASAGAASTDSATAAGAVTRALAQAQSVPGFALHRASAPAYLQLTFNGGSGPLADPELRRAVAQAVDRTRLAESVLGPLGLPALALGNHLVMADQEGYQDDSSALAASPENAARHLDAAGWRLTRTPAVPAASGSAAAAPAAAAAAAAAAASVSASAAAPAAAAPASASAAAAATVPATVRSKDGHALALTLLTRSGSALDSQIAGLLGRQLAASGISLRTRAVTGDSYFADHVAAGDFDLALFSWPASRFPVADEAALFAKPQIGPDGLPVNGQNLSGAGTDEVDQLLAGAVSALDPGEAARLVGEADTRIWQEAPSLPLFQRPELVEVRATVANAGAFGLSTPRFQDLGFTHA